MTLYDDYKIFCNYRRSVKKNIIDLSDATFFRPTTLLPLCAYATSNKTHLVPPSDNSVREYFNIIMGGQSEKDYSSSTYLPFIHFTPYFDGINRVLDNLYKIQNINDFGGENAFKYLVGEIVDNIYEHSEFQHAYVMAQAYKKREFMDVCFVDDGLTINGCFKKNGLLTFNDATAIVAATKGRSTKNDERGYGLSSTIKIIAEGLNGIILIVSGKGLFCIDSKQQYNSVLDDLYRFDGTLVSIRIPYHPQKVDIYKHIG